VVLSVAIEAICGLAQMMTNLRWMAMVAMCVCWERYIFPSFVSNRNISCWSITVVFFLHQASDLSWYHHRTASAMLYGTEQGTGLAGANKGDDDGNGGHDDTEVSTNDLIKPFSYVSLFLDCVKCRN